MKWVLIASSRISYVPSSKRQAFSPGLWRICMVLTMHNPFFFPPFAAPRPRVFRAKGNLPPTSDNRKRNEDATLARDCPLPRRDCCHHPGVAVLWRNNQADNRNKGSGTWLVTGDQADDHQLDAAAWLGEATLVLDGIFGGLRDLRFTRQKRTLPGDAWMSALCQ